MKQKAIMDYFEGTIEHITYYSPDTGYTVFKFVPENGESMTVIGSFPPLSPGEVLKIKGKWVMHPKYGQQFKVENYIPVLPHSGYSFDRTRHPGCQTDQPRQ